MQSWNLEEISLQASLPSRQAGEEGAQQSVSRQETRRGLSTHLPGLAGRATFREGVQINSVLISQLSTNLRNGVIKGTELVWYLGNGGNK